MTKVTLPKEVAEAIEEFRSRSCSNYVVLYRAKGAVFSGPDLILKRWAFDETGTGTPDLLMSALVSGYEIEKSPEEKLRDYYDLAFESMAVASTKAERDESYGVTIGVIKTLNLLGIQIEGVNA